MKIKFNESIYLSHKQQKILRYCVIMVLLPITFYGLVNLFFGILTYYLNTFVPNPCGFGRDLFPVDNPGVICIAKDWNRHIMTVYESKTKRSITESLFDYSITGQNIFAYAKPFSFSENLPPQFAKINTKTGDVHWFKTLDEMPPEDRVIFAELEQKIKADNNSSSTTTTASIWQ